MRAIIMLKLQIIIDLYLKAANLKYDIDKIK